MPQPSRRRKAADTAPAEQDQQQQQGDQQEPSSQDDTNALLRQMLEAQQEHRAEVAALREELAEAKAERAAAPVASPSTILSDEELQERRQKEIAEHDFYCYACGRLYDRERECTGRPEAPHPPLEVISTNELGKDSDPTKHTAAPGVRP